MNGAGSSAPADDGHEGGVRRRWRLAVLGVAVLAAACSGHGDRPLAQAPSEAAAAAGASGPAPSGTGAVCPLTGLPTPSGRPVERPAVAVVVEDSAAARPQAGLQAADVVYQEPVEGDVGWLLAIYQCSDARRVGPVRNPHLADPEILAPYAPVLFAHAGAPPPVAARLGSVAGLHAVEPRSAGAAYARDGARRRPHNLYTSTEKLRALAAVTGSPSPLAFEAPVRPPAARAGTPGPRGSSVRFSLGGETTRYAYDEAAGAYRRFHGSLPHLVEGGSAVQVVNVVLVWARVEGSDLRDQAGTVSPHVAVVGQGPALVLQGGVETSARWVKATASAPLRLVDSAGHELPLSPGNTWVHLLPEDRPAYVG